MPRYRRIKIHVKVPSYSYLRKFKGRKRRKRIFVTGYEYTYIRRQKITPKKKKARKKKVRRKAVGPEWITTSDAESSLRRQARREKLTLDIEDAVHHDKDKDGNEAFEVNTKFIWPRAIRSLSMKNLKGRFVVLVRAWFLMKSDKRGKKGYFIWSRTRSLGNPDLSRRVAVTTLDKAFSHVKDMESALTEQLGAWDYVEFRGLYGWTVWVVGQ